MRLTQKVSQNVITIKITFHVKRWRVMTPSRSQRHSKHIHLKNHVQVWYYLLFKNLFEKFYKIMHDFPNLLWTSWNCIIKCSALGRASFLQANLKSWVDHLALTHIISKYCFAPCYYMLVCITSAMEFKFCFEILCSFLDFHMLSHVVMLGTWVQCLSLWSLWHLQMGVHNWL